MRLFAGSSEQFIEDNYQNQIAEKLKLAFFSYFRYYPSPSEVSSWGNSLKAISIVLAHERLTDQGIILEYQLPLNSKRLDCLICGKDVNNKDNAVIIELKQWDRCEDAPGKENEVISWVGGKRELLHPSVQVHQYKRYLKDTHTAFYEGLNPVILNACSYLHNYHIHSGDVLFSNKFTAVLSNAPLFTADDVNKFSGYLTSKLDKGDGLTVLKRIEESKYRPSKKLMDHVGNVIKGIPEYILLDEQQIVYDSVISCAKSGFHDKQKTVLIIKGGPGTGKSVIAINLMADLLLQQYNAQYATGSRAFTETLKRIVKSRGAAQFKYFNSYTEAQENEIDVLIADEAHRLRQTSFNRFTPKEKRSNIPQIEELIRASKVAVFFIDDDQIVRPGEIGSVRYIEEYAKLNNYKLFQYELEAQFRCNGSDAFVNWVNNTLGIKRTANVIWDQHEEFDLQIFDSPQKLEEAVKEKVQHGNTGRMMAGFCWPWSDPDSEGNLRNDVQIGDYQRPWNAKPEARILAAGIPKSNLWAYEPNGVEQIGCVYTAQGFEFDYAGIIVGKDLTYDLDRQQWVGNPAVSADGTVKRAKGNFTELVKNTYRVLLSRGMKGCYIYFMDKDTERFFKSRIEKP